MKSLLEMTEEELDNLSEDEFVENFLQLSEDDQKKMFEKFPELKSLFDEDDEDHEDDIYAEFDEEVDKIIEEEFSEEELKELLEDTDGESDDESLEDLKNTEINAELSEEELKELED